MHRLEAPLRRLALLAAIVALAGAFAAAPRPAAAAPAAPSAPAPSAGLPPDFPADVPLPPGRLQNATGARGQWSVLLLVAGSAAEAHASTVAFYRARGFTADTDSILHKGTHRITIVAENRDHSAAETFVAIGVTDTRPAARAEVRLGAALAGHGTGSASVVIVGARVCWSVRRLRGIGRPRTAAIRRGAAGPVVVRLGRRYAQSGCTAATAAVARAIAARPQRFSVAVTTARFPRGAVRGPLRP
jgi:CHRD domain